MGRPFGESPGTRGRQALVHTVPRRGRPRPIPCAPCPARAALLANGPFGPRTHMRHARTRARLSFVATELQLFIKVAYVFECEPCRSRTHDSSAARRAQLAPNLSLSAAALAMAIAASCSCRAARRCHAGLSRAVASRRRAEAARISHRRTAAGIAGLQPTFLRAGSRLDRCRGGGSGLTRRAAALERPLRAQDRALALRLRCLPGEGGAAGPTLRESGLACALQVPCIHAAGRQHCVDGADRLQIKPREGTHAVRTRGERERDSARRMQDATRHRPARW